MTKARDLANAADALDDVSATELGYVNGVTSAIQTQLNNKQAVVSGVDDTEIGYLNGVTSSIQTQLDGKIAKSLVDAAGDLIYGSANDTVTRLGIGTAGQYLSVNSGATAPEWTTLSAGGMTLLSTTTLTGSSVTLNSISQSYRDLLLVVRNFRPSVADGLKMRINADSTSNRHIYEAVTHGTNAGSTQAFGTSNVTIQDTNNTGTGNGLSYTEFFDYTNTTTWKFGRMWSLTTDPTTATSYRCYNGYWAYNQTGAISSIYLYPASGTFSAGTALLYGVS